MKTIENQGFLPCLNAMGRSVGVKRQVTATKLNKINGFVHKPYGTALNVFNNLIGKNEHVVLSVLLFISQTALSEIVPASRLVTWQGNVGIPGGVPTDRVTNTTLAVGATMAQIQSALNSCPANRVVQLSAGTYTITGTLVIPSNVTLRGAGAGTTILNATGSGTAVVRFGTEVQGEYVATPHNITSGYTKGSISIVLNNTTGIAVGSLLVLDQLNDATLPVSNVGTYGTINWNSRASGARALGQTVEVTGISGNTVSFSPAMYWTYSAGLAPQAMSYGAGCQKAGLEDLTLKANNTGYTTMFYMSGVKYCWVKGIETDFADGDHGEVVYSFRCEVRDSYFHDGFKHGSGSTDTDVMLDGKTSGTLIENNIFYRCHTSIMLRCGVSGNVIGYNYSSGNYHDNPSSGTFMVQDFNGNHGAHPMFNLFEGNIGGEFQPDSFWGTSSHGTALRNWFLGDTITALPFNARGTLGTPFHVTQALRAINLDFGESYYNIVGNIVGCAYGSSHDVYRVVAPTSRAYQGTLSLFSLGYSDSSDTGGDSKDSTLPFTTGIFHGNYDFVNAAPVWDSGIADHNIPDSYYLSTKPSWFGALNWPPFNPANVSTLAVTNLPAGYRFVLGVNPPAGRPAPPTGLHRVDP